MLPIFLLIASLFGNVNYVMVKAGCCYNTDCDYEYSGVDGCFMSAVFPEDNREGFCWGGSCFGWFGSEGECQMKKTLGEYCINSGGNADNNNCVTGLCESSTQNCELRESGCASLSKCVTLGFNIALALAEYCTPFGGLITLAREVCDDPASFCQGSGSATPDEVDFSITFSTNQYSDLFTLTGTLSANIPDGIGFDLDLIAPDLSVYIQDLFVELQFDVELNLDHASPTIDQDLVLSDKLTVCTDPLNEKEICRPYIVLKKIIRIGVASVVLEVGFQIVGKLTGSITSTSDAVVKFSVSKDITIATLGAQITTSGISMIGVNDLFDQALTLDGDVVIEVDGDSTVDFDAQLRISPQLYVSVNGITVQGGPDFVFKSIAQFTANHDSGCASGGAGVAWGMCMDFYSPPFDIETGMTAACEGVMGWAQSLIDAGEIAADVASNSYGTHCLVELDACEDDRFNLCEEAGKLMSGAMENMVGSTMQTDDIYVSLTLFELNADFDAVVNGATCDTRYETSIDCGDQHVFVGDENFCETDSTEHVVPKMEISLIIILLIQYFHILF